MYYRALGNTGIQVSEVGLGCNRIGLTSQPDDFWVSLLHRAFDLGVNLFDTAEVYTGNRSEEMLGLAFGNRDDVIIATKMSQSNGDERNWSATHMIRKIESNLKRLGREVIDIFQLHSPNRAELERFDWAEGMAKLKDQGKIRFAAVAVNNAPDGVWLIEQNLVEVLQITYNIFNTSAADQLFPLAREAGVGLLSRMPLARGVLTGKFRPGQAIADDHRATLVGDRLTPMIEKVETLRSLGGRYEGGMTRLAHHFCLSQPAISAIIPGARTVEQLEENVAASNRIGLPDDVRASVYQIRAEW